MRITFLGAAGEVTGSSILLEVKNKKILLDCGFFQGYKLAEERNYAPFLFDSKSIDFVVICHAHLDHVGRLPKLVREGFGGRIFSTAPTAELTKLVLEDSAKLMMEEAKRENHEPLFKLEHIEGVMQLFETTPYGKELEIFDEIRLTLVNAGHILGSAVAVLSVEGKRLVYTSDLGNSPSELLPGPDEVGNADFVIIETTYGGRIHEDMALRHTKLNQIINTTIARNGVLMIPTFAIERTQELLHDIEHFCAVGNCAIPTFFLDSPLAEKVTKVFEKYPEFLNKKVKTAHKGKSIFGLERVKMTQTVDESKAIDNAPNPKIIIAGSGMINGGRILFHLQKYISDPKNTLLIVGYQAKGTLGRRLLEGEKEIRIFGKKYAVLANILAIGSYSAHADGPGLLSWISKIKGARKLFLVHGETDQSLAFGKMAKEKLAVQSIIPVQGEEFEL